MKKILFVCTGNTCRSPMAMALFKDAAKKENIDATAFSAGLFTEDGLPYSENSVQALKEEGIALEGSSKQLNAELVRDADMIFGLTASHGQGVISSYPEYADKVYGFPSDISDPFGGDIVTYKRCLAQIKDGIKKIVDYLKKEDKHNEA